MNDSLRPKEASNDPAAKPVAPGAEPELRYDVLTAPAQSPQFSLGEILLVTFGVSLGLAAGRWLPDQGRALGAGTTSNPG